jgi:hypothetical protein
MRTTPTLREQRSSSARSVPGGSAGHVGEHLHHRGHLAHGGALRCGCGPEELTPLGDAAPDSRATASWMPVRHQHAGFVRTRFIYSTRMPGAFRQQAA